MSDTFTRLRGMETDLGQEAYCPACDQDCPDGPDPCLGLIPGVAHACCGHGSVMKAYVVIGGPEGVDADCETFRSLTLQERDALDFFALARRGEIREPEEKP